MRTITAAQAAALAAYARGEKLRVLVKDGAGAWQDLTDVGGFSFLKSVDWGETADEDLSATITLFLQAYDINLSPFMDGSPVNKAWNASASPDPLVKWRREVKVEVQVGAADVEDPGAWMELFSGRIDNHPAGSDGVMTLECRGPHAPIADTFIKQERAYGFGAAKGILLWEEARAYALNDRVLPAGEFTGFIYKCTVAGTSGGTEPTWPTTITNTVVDGGTLTWQCEMAAGTSGEAPEDIFQKALNDYLRNAVTLYVPTASGTTFGGFKLEREYLWESLKRYALMIGWDIRPKWREATSQFEITFFSPDRSKVTSDRTFTRAELKKISKLGIDGPSVRTTIAGIYSDASDLAADGITKKRKRIEVSDSATITEFDIDVYMEIAEDATSPIDSSSKMTTLLNAALSDLSVPLADMEVEAFFFPWVELGDVYVFPTNDTLNDSTLQLAIAGYRHSWSISGEDGTISLGTTFMCRGKPTGGFMRWHEVTARPGIGKSHQMQQLGGASLAVTALGPGTAKLDIAPDLGITEEFEGAEIHTSNTPGFTPNSSTFQGWMRGTSHTLSELEPGVAKYAKVVRRGKNAGKPIIGKPSQEVSFTPSRLKDVFFDPDLGHGPAPLNGGFESYWNAAAMADQWDVVAGTYASNRDVFRSSTSHSAAWGMELRNSTTAAKIRSAYFQAAPGVVFDLSAWLIRSTASDSNTVTVAVEWYTSGKVLIGSAITVGTVALSALASWTRVSARLSAPSTSAYARITVKKDTANAYGVVVDDVAAVEQLDHTALANIGSHTHDDIDGYLDSIGLANGIAELDSGAKVPTAQLGTGSSGASAWLRGDRAWITPDSWTAVGSGGGAPAFANSWVNFDTTNWETAGFYKDPFGWVHLKGMVKNGTISTTLEIFTLPAGYRPAKAFLAATASNNAFGRITVKTDGKVIAEVGSNVWFALWCSFKV